MGSSPLAIIASTTRRKFFRVPMLSRVPPLLYSVVGNEIAHRPLNLAPEDPHKYAIAVGEIHSFEVLEEPIKKRAESEFRDRIEIVERMQRREEKLQQNSAALVQGACQIAPLRSKSIYRRLATLLGLLSDLYREINKGRDSDKDRCQLPDRCEHFPVHPINDSASE